MTDPPQKRLARWGLAVVPLLVPLAVTVAVVWFLLPDDGPEPLDVVSNSPQFDTVEELVAASDLVVIATVGDAVEGRTISDPTDPAAGIRTTLYTLVVETTIAGSGGERVTLEHETALLDGTPITIDGVEAPQVGERSAFFLVAGTTDEFPHHAMVSSQGRYPMEGTDSDLPKDLIDGSSS